jgi:hypothetical protein
MGRRSKCDADGLVEHVIGLYQRDKKTMKQITEILQAEGYTISKSSVHRVIKGNKETVLELRKAKQDAEILLAEVRDNPGTDLIEVGQQLLANRIVNHIKELELDDIEFKDTGDLIRALTNISYAQANTGRLRLEFTAGVAAAKTAIEGKLTELLNDGYPDLLRQLLDALDAIEITKQDLNRAKKSLQ